MEVIIIMKRFLSFLIASVVVLSFSHTTVFANNTHEQEKNRKRTIVGATL